MRFIRSIRRLHDASRGAALRDDRGVVHAETAVIALFLAGLSLGVVDFSLAFSLKSEMNNAVRSGTQFALVRKPALGPSADEQEELISINDIRNRVVESATFLEADPGSPALDVNVFCECPDSTPVECTADPGTPLPCQDRITFLRINMNQTYAPILPYPGFPDPVSLQATNTIRLN